jgi:small subunit ribosomal protein S6
MFILDSGRYSRDPEGVSGAISTMIQETGGEVLVSRLWEERRLAYPIQGQRKGTYWLTYFRLDSVRLAELQRKCQLNESILRFLFLKVDPRIVDTLVEHAKSGHAVVPRETVEGASEDRKEEERPTRERAGAGARGGRAAEAVPSFEP